MKSWLSTLILFGACLAQAEARHELGLQGGTFLVTGASQNLPVLGGRFSLALDSNHAKFIEARGFGANTNGTSYYLGAISIRNEFTVEKMSALWLLGFDWHYLRAATATEFDAKQGWHVGAGLNVSMGKNLMFRNDYILRFANGMSLTVNLGFAWAFGAGEE